MEKNSNFNGLLSVSPAPHIRNRESVAKIMWTVNAALAPAAIFAVWIFGASALFNMLCPFIPIMITNIIW